MSDTNTTPEPQAPAPEVTTPAPVPPAASQETQEELLAKLQLEAQNALTVAETERTAREKAEAKIVDMKRKAKEFGMEDEDEPQPLDGEAIAARAAEIAVAAIAAQKPQEESELARSRRTIEELTEALKAKNSTTNSGAGNNQDRYEPDEAPKLSAAEEDIISRRAAQKGQTVAQYLKENKPLSGPS